MPDPHAALLVSVVVDDADRNTDRIASARPIGVAFGDSRFRATMSLFGTSRNFARGARASIQRT
jgi:hypothetical protein